MGRGPGNNRYFPTVPGFNAKPGYDLASGVGVPQFASLVRDLPAPRLGACRGWVSPPVGRNLANDQRPRVRRLVRLRSLLGRRVQVGVELHPRHSDLQHLPAAGLGLPSDPAMLGSVLRAGVELVRASLCFLAVS